MGWGASPLRTSHAQIVYTPCICTACTPGTVYPHHIHTRYSIHARYAHSTCMARIDTLYVYYVLQTERVPPTFTCSTESPT